MPRGCEICGTPTRAFPLDDGGHLDQCPTCGHLHRDLRTAPAGAREAAYGGDPALDAVRTRLTHRWVRAGRSPRSVFEIGYGSGALLRRFHDDGAQIAGVDPDQLSVGLDPVVAAHGRLWNGTIETVPDGAARVDLVVGVHVIEHVEDPALTLRKARSLLDDDGNLVLLTPAGDSWGLRRYGAAWWMLEDPTHVRFFTADSLHRLAEAAGFTDIRIDRLVLDSISVDAASVARTRRTPGRTGVLDSPVVRGLALATAPPLVALRALAPRTRPTLRLVARCGR